MDNLILICYIKISTQYLEIIKILNRTSVFENAQILHQLIGLYKSSNQIGLLCRFSCCPKRVYVIKLLFTHLKNLLSYAKCAFSGKIRYVSTRIINSLLILAMSLVCAPAYQYLLTLTSKHQSYPLDQNVVS